MAGGRGTAFAAVAASKLSPMMKEFPPSHHVAAALLLFGTVATLFWYVLQMLMSLRGND